MRKTLFSNQHTSKVSGASWCWQIQVVVLHSMGPVLGQIHRLARLISFSREAIPLRWTIAKTPSADTAADLLVFPVFQVNDKADTIDVLAGTKGGVRQGTKRNIPAVGLAEKITASGFTAAKGTCLPVFCSNTKAGWLLLVGMGEAKEVCMDSIRRAAALTAREARKMKVARVLVAVSESGRVNLDDAAIARSWVEGAEMALTPTGVLKSGKKAKEWPTSWKLLAEAGRHKDLRAGQKEGESYVSGCAFARDLVNQPPNYLTPEALGKAARAMAGEEGLNCTILNVPQLKKLKMGGLLGVGQGSTNPPCLVVLEYKGGKSKNSPTIALVGKGVTFDTGGISLKPGAGMDDMKADMGGAAAVLGAARIVAQLGLDANLVTIVPAAENMPDAGALKPADVVTISNGTTVEILNTDAEGRLILADGLVYARKFKPDFIIDAATLTGACVIALGHEFAGLMSTSSELIESLQQAGSETFERVWPLPLIDEHKDVMKGTWSDLKNLGPREGGAMNAAGFLSHFVEEGTAWAHLDIAGPAHMKKATATCPEGGTGFGARLMARAVQILAG